MLTPIIFGVSTNTLMPFFSHNPKSHSNPGPYSAGSQHLIQPQNTYKRFRIFLSRLGCRSQVPGVDTVALGIRPPVLDGHEHHTSVDIASDITREPHHDPFNTSSMKTEGRNPIPIMAEPTTFPIATQFQGAQGFNISGHPQFTNIGGNVTTVNNYGGTHGLENLKDFVSFAALHDAAEQDPTRRCHPGTRKKILSRLGNWFDKPNATERICWLHGPAGAGKSAIAQTIAHEYKKRGVAATFFFYRSDAERNDGNRLFPTLAWQLAFSIPAIKNFIVHALNDTPHLPRKDVETQFEQLVVYPFEPTNITPQMQQPAPVVIIDGVDECSDEQLQRRILTVIGSAVKECRVPFRFLICSRPEALIEEIFDRFKDITLRIDLATLDDSNYDIEKYLVDQFSIIASKSGLDPSWPKPEIIEEFVFKSSGNFILAATVMRYISDEDYSPEDQLDIVRNLKPSGKMSPFALLDELYLEILKQQRDQDFLKTFLALFIGRSSTKGDDLHKDDAILMNVSGKDLHVKLRRMRSLLKFQPFIDVYHKSFLDFLQDPFRSGQYHVSKQDGQQRYLELIVESVVRRVSSVIEQPNDHEECRCTPRFRSVVKRYPPSIVLPIEDWQKILKPLLDLQDRILNTLKPQPCRFTQVMRHLLLHLAILQGNPRHIAAIQALRSNPSVTERGATLATEAKHENDLDRYLSGLLSGLQITNLAIDAITTDRMSSLLVFDSAETAARVRSVIDAQKVIDIIDLLTNNQTFLSQCDRDAARQAALLASEIYARVPLLPQSVFLNEPPQLCDRLLDLNIYDLELACQSMLITRILDYNHILSESWVYQGDGLKYVYGNVNEQEESLGQWLERSKPNFVTRIRVMLEVGRTVRYIHSMDAVAALNSEMIDPVRITSFWTPICVQKSHLVVFFAWQVKEKLIYDHEEESGYLTEFTSESNISAFADLFYSVCFGGGNENLPNHLVEDALQLIERCREKDPKSRPTMENVVKEMEAWNLF